MKRGLILFIFLIVLVGGFVSAEQINYLDEVDFTVTTTAFNSELTCEGYYPQCGELPKYSGELDEYFHVNRILKIEGDCYGNYLRFDFPQGDWNYSRNEGGWSLETLGDLMRCSATAIGVEVNNNNLTKLKNLSFSYAHQLLSWNNIFATAFCYRNETYEFGFLCEDEYFMSRGDKDFQEISFDLTGMKDNLIVFFSQNHGRVVSDINKVWIKNLTFYKEDGSIYGEPLEGTIFCSCPSGEICSNGFCVDECIPNCTNKYCGDDGCGGSCGECDDKYLCSNEGVCEPLFSSFARWEDMTGDKIDGADYGDYVMASVSHGDILEGENYTLKIIIKGEALIPYFSTSIVYETEIVAEDNFSISHPWKIDLDQEVSDRELYFVLEDSFSNELNRSDDLTISPFEDDPMTVNLVSPACGEDFILGDVAEITVSASDKDDLIYGNVTIDGRDFPFSNGVTSFDYTLGRAGNVGIVVYAENSRGERSRVNSNIMVVDNTSSVDRKYLAACIDEPKDFARIPSGWVLFNASSTRALQYTGSTKTTKEIPKKDLTFDWVFSDGDFRRNRDTGNEPYFFRKFFNRGGDNQARLSVGFRS